MSWLLYYNYYSRVVVRWVVRWVVMLDRVGMDWGGTFFF